MVHIAAPHCLRYPDSTHVELMSLTMLKTVITTLQGVSALYTLIGSLYTANPGSFWGPFGLDALFFPLAILGLIRLFAATWLTQDFVYGCYSALRDDAMSEIPLQNKRYLPVAHNTTDLNLETSYRHNNLDPFLITPSQHTEFTPPGMSWNSRLFRLFFLLVLGGVWSIALLWMIPVREARFTTTSFMMGFFYIVFVTVSFVLYAYYFARGQMTTTVLPCLSTTWYKLYTLVIMGLILALVVVASIETNKSIEGYTSRKPHLNLGCLERRRLLFFDPQSYMSMLALDVDLDGVPSLPVQALQSDSASAGRNFSLYNFTGSCVGHIDGLQ
jgi:hypothetical protein